MQCEKMRISIVAAESDDADGEMRVVVTRNDGKDSLSARLERPPLRHRLCPRDAHLTWIIICRVVASRMTEVLVLLLVVCRLVGRRGVAVVSIWRVSMTGRSNTAVGVGRMVMHLRLRLLKGAAMGWSTIRADRRGCA